MSTNLAPSPVSANEALLTLVAISLLVFSAVSYFVPPAPVPATAPASEFSAQRALEHLKVIAREPHPTGSIPNARVRDYIVERLKSLGLEPVVQKAVSGTLWDDYMGAPHAAGTVANVIARLKGTNSTEALLLMAHYDSVQTGPGAGDNGNGVAALLETLRALRSGSPPRSDVILAFTDGEEDGGLGAQAFVDEYPPAKQVLVALNVDSSRCGSAAFVVDSQHQHNGWLVRQAARALRHPLGSSISDALKDALKIPDYSDSLCLYPKGIEVLDPGCISSDTGYHTIKDNVENLDAGGVQDLGNYCLALARHFGNLKLKHAPEGNVVYFPFFGRLIFYPVTWVLPLMAVTAAIFAGVLLLGFRRGRLDSRGVGLGLALWLAAVAAGGGLVALLCWALQALNLVSRVWLLAPAYNAETYAVGFVALATAITSALFVRFRQKADAVNLTMGALLLCAALMVVSCWFAPGASFLFMWPLAFAVLPLGIGFALQRPASHALKVARLLCAAPAVFLFTLVIGFLVVSARTGIGDMMALAILTVVGLALIAPQLEALTAQRKWLLPGASALLGIGFISFGALRSGYDANHPKTDSISYWLDTDTGKASWVSFDEKPDSWTSQFLTGRVEASTLRVLHPLEGDAILKADAPRLQMPPPNITTLEDSTTGGERTLRFHITSPRRARIIWVLVQKAGVIGATLEGKKVQLSDTDTRNKFWGIVYVGLPSEGIKLDFTVKASESPQLTVTDQSDGLPDIPGFHVKPRPDDRMSLPVFWPFFDSTVLVSRTFPNAGVQVMH